MSRGPVRGLAGAPAKGPSMQRSRIQLATSYAPGSYFTFEGGKGCFLSMVSGLGPSALDRDQAVRQQISEQLIEFVTSWHQRGMECRAERAELPPVHIEQVLDASLVLRGIPQVDIDAFSLVEPARVGYAPAPLNFHCASCGLLHYYETVDAFAKKHRLVEARADCSGGMTHRWRQLDVFFNHWSGSVEPLHPSRNCSCGGSEFRLHKSPSGVFSDWKFQCADCGTSSNLIRRDGVTSGIFRLYPETAHDGDESTMIPVSYRSTTVHYPQLERFIPHNDLEMVSKLQPGQEDDLTRKLMSLYGYPNPELDEEALRNALEKKGAADQLVPYTAMKEMAAKERDRGNLAMAAICDDSAKTLMQVLITTGVVEKVAEPDPVLRGQCFARREYARRYDPIRLGIEHAMIEKKHLLALRGHADLKSPSTDIRPEWANCAEGLMAYQSEMEGACRVLGIEKIALIRELDIVQYSFGFSRVKHVPSFEFKGKPMPVRLNLYPHIERGKRPIYTLNQKNEAIYVRLGEAQIIAWLEANQVALGGTLAPGQKLGSRYLEQYLDFGYYLESFRKKDATGRNLCNMVYLLLHTMAHQMIHVIAEFSGLELGSLGECIYPADCAFVVYRSALTPDLGNISSMWRNFGTSILRQMHDPQMLQCGSGTLCDQRGGACPGCIMVPEVVCLAWNDLLSRSALAGGSKPHWDSSLHQRLTGFLEVTTNTAREVQ